MAGSKLAMLTNMIKQFPDIVQNAIMTRQGLLDALMDPRRDMNKECGYPEEYEPTLLYNLYRRDGISKRVVELYPSESWRKDPEVYETEDAEKTPFEEEFDTLVKSKNLWYWLNRLDELSGIGRYGVLYLGVNDGKDPSEPLAGIPEDDSFEVTTVGTPAKLPITKNEGNVKLVYLRALHESCIQIHTRDTDFKSPRYSKPILYSLTFRDSGTGNISGGRSESVQKVHWTRVIHFADNCLDSEVMGTPRMEVVGDRLCDNRKVASSSGEMFYKGAFPGLSLEVDPNKGDPDMDPKDVRKEMARYANGLSRYLALVGVSVKSLATQIADPGNTLDAIIEQICIALACPKRIFTGSEQGQLASGQDQGTWNDRMHRRREQTVSPKIVRPTIERLMNAGVLSKVKFDIAWPDLNSSTDAEKATVAYTRAQALSLFMSSGLETVMTFADFLTQIMEMDEMQVAEIVKNAQDSIAVIDEAKLHDAEIQAKVNDTLAIPDTQGTPPKNPNLPKGK